MTRKKAEDTCKDVQTSVDVDHHVQVLKIHQIIYLMIFAFSICILFLDKNLYKYIHPKIYICVCIYIHICIYTPVYMFVYVCACIRYEFNTISNLT